MTIDRRVIDLLMRYWQFMQDRMSINDVVVSRDSVIVVILFFVVSIGVRVLEKIKLDAVFLL